MAGLTVRQKRPYAKGVLRLKRRKKDTKRFELKSNEAKTGKRR
jgi:hypothetical protein